MDLGVALAFSVGNAHPRQPLCQGRELWVSLVFLGSIHFFFPALPVLTSGFLEFRFLYQGAHFIFFFLLLIHRHS